MAGTEDSTILEDIPLYGAGGGCGCAQGEVRYDEDGVFDEPLSGDRVDPAVLSTANLGTPLLDPAGGARNCSLRDLDGSWLLQLTRRGPHQLVQIRGPMRIEAGSARLRVSGDIYVAPLVGPATANTTPARLAAVEVMKPFVTNAVIFRRNWYPQLPQRDYSWYFRSAGVTYRSGRLKFSFVRHVWDRIRSEFVSEDRGQMEFECTTSRIVSHASLPQSTIEMRGTVKLGGVTYDAVATKTSPFYRGCRIEVDVMANRSFPLSATDSGGAVVTFESAYRTAGWDVAVTVDQTDLVEDVQLTTAEMHAALTANRRPATSPDAWRFWLMVGSAVSDGSFGLMFDDITPHREGAVGFFDPKLSNDAVIAASARGQKLGDVAAAFLRTLVHEAGHGFNLYHPKHDVHTVPIGTTIMNQTGDVMSFATAANTYPGNISFSFDDHNRNSLIHSPDPQVSPGWKPFGWGHGSLSSGVPEPLDALGLPGAADRPGDLSLELSVPDVLFRGEFVTAAFKLTNGGSAPRAVSAALNLAQGDLRLLVTPPHGEVHDVRDSIVLCGDRPMTVLQPGESLIGNAQIFFTNQGFTFRQTGRYILSAEFDVGDGSGEMVRSAPETVVVRAPLTPEEEEIARLSMKPAIGGAFARGDFGIDEEARASLSRLADAHGGTDTGIAATLVLANAHGSPLRDLRSGECLRPRDAKAAQAHFARAAEATAAEGHWGLVRLATAVAAPTEADAPVLDLAAAYLSGAKPAGDKGKKALASAQDEAYGADEGAALLSGIRRTFASL
jgi:hypothetical protein